MQAIILAAGMGKRLGKLTESDTMCMLEVNGIKLIDRALEALEEAGITKLCIVIGYKGSRVQSYLGNRWGSIDISYVENSDYAKTNNIYSLLLASDFLKSDDTILLESDLIFEKEVIKELVEDPRENIVLVDKFQTWMDGTVISFNEEGIVNKFYSKKEQSNLVIEDFYKTVNIYKFSAKFSKYTYAPFLESYCKSVGLNEYYESVLSTIASLNQENLFAREISPRIWHEIDDVLDHATAETMFAKEENLHKAYSRRFGGYWRFPKLKDYCYLVNPYFPTERFNEVLKAEFNTLLSEYPSGLSVIESAAANLFQIDPSLITVGNGASELIIALSECLQISNVGYFNPSFDEYSARFARHKLQSVNTFNLTHEQLLQELINLSKSCDYIVLVNPDNPTGRFVNPNEILGVLGELKLNNCTLILDESFVDFSELFELGTVLRDQIFQQYSNLIVIKSISKSYGVAGIRLGVLATSNKEILEGVRKKLPVWNINSFAEKFLQKITYFQSDYWQSCRKLSDAREDFSRELRNSGVRVWDSASNFLMLEMNNLFDLDGFANYMIGKNFLIKTLTEKPGIPKGNFLRVAVKSEEENREFVQELRKYQSTFNSDHRLS